jgi:hypothetical protein
MCRAGVNAHLMHGCDRAARGACNPVLARYPVVFCAACETPHDENGCCRFWGDDVGEIRRFRKLDRRGPPQKASFRKAHLPTTTPPSYALRVYYLGVIRPIEVPGGPLPAQVKDHVLECHPIDYGEAN